MLGASGPPSSLDREGSTNAASMIFSSGASDTGVAKEDRLEAAGRKKYQIAIEYGPERV